MNSPQLRLHLLLALGTVLAAPAVGQLPFRDVDPARVEAGTLTRDVVPRAARILEVDGPALSALLRSAPPEGDGPVASSRVELLLPMPDGSDELFRVVESPVLEPGLAARFPEIRTYLAQGVTDPTATARLDETPQGFHAMVLRAGPTVYVDPLLRGSARYVQSYLKRDAARAEAAEPRLCAFAEANPGADGLAAPDLVAGGDARRLVPLAASGTSLRTYRLALAGTGEYTTRVCQPAAAAVACGLAAMATSMNRVNGIYERDVAIRMVLIANNNLIVYTNGATDPYTNGNGVTMLGQNQANLDAVIGTANYDIGHVFSTGGGGVATLNGPCNASSKARGVTGSTNPVGDAYDVDYVAHEMGHQFGALHTFNGTTGSCGGGNRSSSAAYEPGSGTTIMAYAGICGAENIQPHSDDHFHVKSFDEIVAFSTGAGGSCPASAATGNTPPTVSAGATRTIPASTPFVLTGSASDPNGDALTYCWEEYDLGTASPPNTDDGSRPIFRSFSPASSPSRTFPRMSDVLAGTSTLGEALPTTNRTMKFRLTVRDNRAGGGGVDWAQTSVTVAASAGPFAVTQPASGSSWPAGGSRTVAWNVAGTSGAPVGCSTVRVLLSTDGGATFGTVLAASTANDGSEAVPVPNVTTSTAKVMVECVGNAFFNVSPGTFSIGPGGGNTAPTFTPAAATSRTQGSAGTAVVVGTVTDAETAAGSLVVTLQSVPPGISVTGVTNSGGTVTATVAAACTATLGANSVVFQVSDGSLPGTGTFVVNVVANAAPTVGLYGATTVVAGASTVVTPSAPPSDAGGGVASFTATSASFTGSLSTSVATGAVTASNAGPVGTHTVAVTATDTCGVATQTFFVLTVTAANTAPAVVPSAVSPAVRQGAAAAVVQLATVSDTETAAGSLSVSLVSAPAALTVAGLTNTAGVVRASLSASCAAALGAGSIVLRVSDGSLSSQGTVAVSIAPPAPPAISAPSATLSGTALLWASVPASAGAAYAWTLTNGTITGGQGTSQITFTAGAAGPMELGVVETKAGSCASEQARKTVTVGPAGSACVMDGPTLCLNDGRFRVRVLWESYGDGSSGAGRAVSMLPAPSDSGYFWFFAETNLELFVKVLDGRGVNGSFWVLYGALTDVEFTMTVEDVQTGAVKTYSNPPHVQASVADIEAFPQAAIRLEAPGAAPESLAGALLAWSRAGRTDTSAAARAVLAPGPALAAAGCTAGPETLCLNGSRFEVKVAWTSYTTGASATGRAIPLLSDSGAFWFFDSDNVELAIKVLDGRGVNGKFWVLYGALTDVAYTITIRDTQSGATRTYANPAHVLGSKADIEAF